MWPEPPSPDFGGGNQKSGFVVPTGDVLFPLFWVILFLFGENLKKRATNYETYLLGGLEMVSNIKLKIRYM